MRFRDGLRRAACTPIGKQLGVVGTVNCTIAVEVAERAAQSTLTPVADDGGEVETVDISVAGNIAGTGTRDGNVPLDILLQIGLID